MLATVLAARLREPLPDPATGDKLKSELQSRAASV